MYKKIRIALIGCGRISKKHIDAIYLLQAKAELVAICDFQVERLDKTEEYIKTKYSNETIKLERYTEYSQLISDARTLGKNIDLVVLATPSGFHAEQTLLAARAGINICTENKYLLIRKFL